MAKEENVAGLGLAVLYFLLGHCLLIFFMSTGSDHKFTLLFGFRVNQIYIISVLAIVFAASILYSYIKKDRKYALAGTYIQVAFLIFVIIIGPISGAYMDFAVDHYDSTSYFASSILQSVKTIVILIPWFGLIKTLDGGEA